MNKFELIEQLEIQDDDGQTILALLLSCHHIENYVITSVLKLDIVCYPLVYNIIRRGTELISYPFEKDRGKAVRFSYDIIAREAAVILICKVYSPILPMYRTKNEFVNQLRNLADDGGDVFIAMDYRHISVKPEPVKCINTCNISSPTRLKRRAAIISTSDEHAERIQLHDKYHRDMALK